MSEMELNMFKNLLNLTNNIVKYKLLDDKNVQIINDFIIIYTNKMEKRDFDTLKIIKNEIMNIIFTNFEKFKQIFLSLDIKLINNILKTSYTILNPSLFGFTIPNYKVLIKIKKISKNKSILEIGAGNGLWASLLQKLGVNIIPTDIKKSQHYYTHIYEYNNIDSLNKYNCDILMMVWPPGPDDTMAYETLKLFKNNIFIYIGETTKNYDCACNGDKLFFKLLTNKWKLIESNYVIPFYYGDYLNRKLNELLPEHKMYLFHKIL